MRRNRPIKLAFLILALLLTASVGCASKSAEGPPNIGVWGTQAGSEMQARVIKRLTGLGFVIEETSDYSVKLLGSFGSNSDQLSIQLLRSTQGHDPGLFQVFTVIPIDSMNAYTDAQIAELNSVLQDILDTEKSQLRVPHEPYANQ